MNKIDYLSLNGHSLRTFLTVLEESSVSKAAERLDVSQSAVSHTLDKLRAIFDDPLFVRSGRSIDATERAEALREPIESILANFKSLTAAKTFNPKSETLVFKVAVSDFVRDLIFPSLIQSFIKEGIKTRFQFTSSGVPDATILRQDKIDLIITPFPPEGPDIYQQKLFDDHLVCFYDATMRSAPKNRKELSSSDFVEAKISQQKSSLEILSNHDISQLKKPTVSVPNFEGIERFILGSEMITVASSLLSINGLKNLDYAPLPFKAKKLPVYMVWHKRDHNAPAHRWFREQMKIITKNIPDDLLNQ